uniref:Uncharacterized protein n=1 Tax=Meloidogyne floridensis TaxID=298350 RepID=A0A915NUK0_9BILA
MEGYEKYKHLEDDYVKLFFEQLDDNEWNNLYWKISENLLNENTEDNFQIKNILSNNLEENVKKFLFNYENKIEMFQNELQILNEENDEINKEERKIMANKHLNAIKTLIVDDNNEKSKLASNFVEIDDKNDPNNDKIYLTKGKMRKILGGLMFDELELYHPVLLKIG